MTKKKIEYKGAVETTARTKLIIPKQIDIHYIKTSSYRTYYMDGIFGGLSPNGKLYVELFLQRQPTPQIIQQEVNPAGDLGKELKRVGKTGLVREIEAGIVMDITTAKVFKEWLEGRIEEHERQTTLLDQADRGGKDAL